MYTNLFSTFIPAIHNAVTDKNVGQWEQDYAMKELNDSVIDEMYTELGNLKEILIFDFNVF